MSSIKSEQLINKVAQKQLLPKPAGNTTRREIFPTPVVQRSRLNPRSLTSGDISQLQRTIGNRATAQLLNRNAQSDPSQKKDNTAALPNTLKSGIESLSGFSMDDVKVHYNSSKPIQLKARAYAQGSDIYVAPKQEKYLPHEAWHVVQQKQGRVEPTMQMKGLQVNREVGLEKEADTLGNKALYTTGLSKFETKRNTKNLNAITQSEYTRIEPAQKERDNRNDTLGRSESRPGVVQGFFGFEMELPVLLTQEDGFGKITEPAATNLETIGNLELHKDHMANPSLTDQLDHRFPNTLEGTKEKLKFQAEDGIPIVELVNKKMDETTLSEGEVENQMIAMKDYAENILLITNNLTQVANLTGDLYVGATGSKAVNELMGNTQASYGVRLSAVPSAMEWHGNPKKDTNKQAQSLTDAVSKADLIITELKLENGLDELDAPALKGLISLLCSYLIATREKFGKSAILKNRTGPLFYKSHLDEVRAKLGTTDGAGKFIEDHQAEIKEKILIQTSRPSDQKVFLSISEEHFTCGEWLDGILEGREDTIAEEGIDSKKLGPDELGPNDDKEWGPVLENRKLDLIFPPDKAPQFYKTSKWPDLGKQVYRKLKQINRVP